MSILRHKKIVLGVLILILFTLVYMGAAERSTQAQVAFLNIGQGDATLVTLPGSVQILIDGGADSTILEKLARYMPLQDRTIELIILSHPHADHARGLIYVLENYTVERALVSGVVYESGTYTQFIDTLAQNNTSIFAAHAGDRVYYNARPLMHIISPQETALGRKYAHVHESTVVAQLALGELSFLFTGDIEEKTEEALVSAGAIRNIDVLKVAHQGSKTSSTRPFLSAALPEIAVVSVGSNSYGHPHQEVLDRLSVLGSHIMRTNEQGDIIWTFTLE